MNDREKKARGIHRRGTGCSHAVYSTFSDINKRGSGAPAARSEGGKCGAVLAAEKTLRELGINRIDEFEKQFLEEFGSLMGFPE